MPSRLVVLARPAALLAIVVLGVVHLHSLAGYTLDDAYITFRYARQLVAGLGLVYNAGDYVKGYSNTLYTFAMTLPEWFGRDPILFSKAIGVASFLAVCALGYRLYNRADAPAAVRDRSLWLLALLAASSPIAVHCSGGLETGSYMALAFAAVLRRSEEQAAGGRPWSALLFCAVVWSRPEGVLIFAAMAVHDALFRLWTRQWRRSDLLFYLAPALAYAGELALSFAYYGSAFPQTYYAKTRAAAGLLEHAQVFWDALRAQLRPESYLSLGLAATGFGYAGLGFALLGLIDPRSRRRNLALFAALVAQLVFVVRASDDWAPAFRFGVPMLPFWFVLIVDALGQIARWAHRVERPALHLLGAGALALSLPLQLRASAQIAVERPVNAENKLSQGHWLATLARPGITLSSFDIGGFGYAAGGFDILDVVGLTVRETLGCRDRMRPRCVRYAELVGPELIRLHNNRKRDAFVANGARRQGEYLELDGGKFLLDRALVFAPLPVEVAPQAPEPHAGARSIAWQIPAVLRCRRSTQLTVHWRREAADVGALAERRLEWIGPAGHFSAHASGSLLRHLAADAWREGEVFADLVRVTAPVRPGRYALQLIAAGRRRTLGTVECVDEAGAARAAQGAIEAAGRAATELAKLQLLERAVEIAPSAVEPYQRAVVAYARPMREAAEREATRDPIAALRLAQRAKVWLVRAAWQSGGASAALRSEIDANAALRRRIIAAELAALR